MPGERPEAAVAQRPLHLFFVLDASGSMAVDGKIQALNNAIRETLPHVAEVARHTPEAIVLVRAVAFATGARWHVAAPSAPDELEWPDLTAGGYSDLGAALRMLAAELRIPPMPARAYPPAIVLVSDGLPTDDYAGGLQVLQDEPWGRQSVRLAVAIGRDADAEILKEFIGPHGPAPVTANNPEQLVELLRFTTALATRSASIHAEGSASHPVALAADELADDLTDDVVW